MLEDATSDLYVRPCYGDLFEAQDKYIEERKGKGYMTFFTGTPGMFLDVSES